MKDRRAFVVADDKVEKFLNERANKKEIKKMQKIAKRFERHLKKKEPEGE